jgi:hypothetical protein
MKLIDGRIPAFTECPYKDKCEAKVCHHTGTKHKIPFSCAFARAFELLEKYQSSYVRVKDNF